MPQWVFVWTVEDIIGLILISGAVIVFGVLFVLIVVDNLWVKMTGKHLPYNRKKL